MLGPDDKHEGSTGTEQGAETADAAAKPAQQPERPPLEIDFSTFVMSLASSALLHLGELRLPGIEQPAVDLSLARQTIDILGMLHEKTRGNLTEPEEKLIEHLVYDLRLKFVEAKKRAG